MKNTPIDPTVIDQFWEAVKLRGKYEDEIIQRIDYILRRIYQEFGGTIKCWYFDSAAEGEVGELTRYLEKDYVSGYHTEATGVDEEMLILLDGTIWELSSFPTRWLAQPFEKEFVEGRAAYLAQVAEKSKKTRAAKEAKQAAKAAVLSKLTKADRKILGL